MMDIELISSFSAILDVMSSFRILGNVGGQSWTLGYGWVRWAEWQERCITPDDWETIEEEQ